MFQLIVESWEYAQKLTLSNVSVSNCRWFSPGIKQWGKHKYSQHIHKQESIQYLDNFTAGVVASLTFAFEQACLIECIFIETSPSASHLIRIDLFHMLSVSRPRKICCYRLCGLRLWVLAAGQHINERFHVKIQAACIALRSAYTVLLCCSVCGRLLHWSLAGSRKRDIL